ncbi:MAG TPA: hypothetical protein VFJ16_12485 [Longimicrobium sp.]|nr:hypothetical protein [Longimicrobium sp.]
MKSKMKLDLDAVRVESCEMMAPIVIDAEPTQTQPVSKPCCYSVYVN